MTYFVCGSDWTVDSSYVRGYGFVTVAEARGTPADLREARIRRPPDEPHAGRDPVHRDVDLAVAVVIRLAAGS